MDLKDNLARGIQMFCDVVLKNRLSRSIHILHMLPQNKNLNLLPFEIWKETSGEMKHANRAKNRRHGSVFLFFPVKTKIQYSRKNISVLTLSSVCCRARCSCTTQPFVFQDVHCALMVLATPAMELLRNNKKFNFEIIQYGNGSR